METTISRSDHMSWCKKRALEYLSELLSHEQTALESEELFSAFLERERLGSTAIGHGVAIPHIRSDKINKPLAALLHLSESIDFGNNDEPVDLVLGLIVPTEDPEQHLGVLAEIARQFSVADFRQQLRQASDNQSLHSIAIKNYDQPRHCA